MKKKASRKTAKKREKPIAARFAKETNIVLIDPAVLDVFPDADSVNEALRALAPMIRRRRKSA